MSRNSAAVLCPSYDKDSGVGKSITTNAEKTPFKNPLLFLMMFLCLFYKKKGAIAPFLNL